MDCFKDRFWLGLAIGFAVPLTTGLAVWLIAQKLHQQRGIGLAFIACVAVNALIMNVFLNGGKIRLGKGLLAATFFWAMVFFLYKMI